MAPVLGKRKRRSSLSSHSGTEPPATSNEDSARLRSLLQRHFEATYAPLSPLPVQEQAPGNEDTGSQTDDLNLGSDNGSEDSGDSEWEGIFDEGDARDIEVIEHTVEKEVNGELAAKVQRKAYMVHPPFTIQSKLTNPDL